MDELRDSTVLVTGGAGFIGSNLANELATENEVRVVDDGHLGIRENVSDDVEFWERSVLDDGLPTAVDVVFHLAGLSSSITHEESPRRGARVNVEGFVSAVEQARSDGCSTVVYASSAAPYGNRTRPTSEESPVTAGTAYQASMLARERYAEYFADHSGMNVAGLRLFSVYQGYETYREKRGVYANPIAQFADEVAHGRSPTVYGDGTQTRDFTHVDDVVDGLIAAAEHRLSSVYNLGTGRAVSLNELVEMIAAELGADVEPEYLEHPIPAEAFVHDELADASKLRAETGWKPSVSLERGVARVCSKYLPRAQ